MSNTKLLLQARHMCKDLTDNDVTAIDAELYLNEELTAVKAVHVQSVYDYEEDAWAVEYSQPYCWYLPVGFGQDIEAGDALVVETTVGVGTALVMAIGKPYKLSKEQHIENWHPYCRVYDNVGALPFKGLEGDFFYDRMTSGGKFSEYMD